MSKDSPRDKKSSSNQNSQYLNWLAPLGVIALVAITYFLWRQKGSTEELESRRKDAPEREEGEGETKSMEMIDVALIENEPSTQDKEQTSSPNNQMIYRSEPGAEQLRYLTPPPSQGFRPDILWAPKKEARHQTMLANNSLNINAPLGRNGLDTGLFSFPPQIPRINQQQNANTEIEGNQMLNTTPPLQGQNNEDDTDHKGRPLSP